MTSQTIDTTPIIVAFLTGVAGPILVLIVKEILKKMKPAPDMIKEACEIGDLITSKIDHVKDLVDADRVWVAQFHNGGHFYPTGKSIAKFSIFYESVNVGIPSIQSNFQNIPVNLFSKSVNELLKTNSIEIPNVSNHEVPSFGLRYIGEDSKCKSIYIFAIKTIDDKFIGALGVTFTKRVHTLDEHTIQQLHIQAAQIGGVLMNHLTKKS